MTNSILQSVFSSLLLPEHYLHFIILSTLSSLYLHGLLSFTIWLKAEMAFLSNGPFSMLHQTSTEVRLSFHKSGWGGKSFTLMYCIYGEIRTVYCSSKCSSAFEPTTWAVLTQLIRRRVCFLLPFVALPYDIPRWSYASTKLTRSLQSDLPPSLRRFSISMKVLPLLFELGECRRRWNMASYTVISVVHGL